MTNYWIWPHEYPEPAAELAAITETIRAMNPIMLESNGIQWPIVSAILEQVVAGEFDEAALRNAAREQIDRLAEYRGTQEIHVQLANLWLQSVFTFGGVEIHPIRNSGDTREYHILYESPFSYGGPPDAVASFAVVPEAQGLSSRAWENAILKVEEVLGLLRAIGLPTLWGREWREAGIAGRGFGSSWVMLRRRHLSRWDMSMARSPTLAFMDLPEMLRNYSRQEIESVEAIFVKSNPSKMDHKLLQALQWMGDSTFPAPNASKFAKLSIAFETAIGGQAKGDDELREIGITEMLAERVAFLLGTNMDTRLFWHTAVKKLYGSRSKVMHGELDPINSDDLSKWAFLVWRSIRALLRRSSELRDVEAFLRWIREQRYTLPT